MKSNTLNVDPTAVAAGLAIAVGLLSLASLACTVTVWLTGYDYVFGLIPSFRLDHERSVPTFFSAGLLALSACLLALIAALQRRQGERQAWNWLILACGFALMSLDEIVGLHEKLIEPVRAGLALDGPSVFYFAWVVPGLVLVVLVGLYFIPFVLWLPRQTGRLFVLAAAVYLAGAIGMELVGGYYASGHPERVDPSTQAFFRYDLIVTVEETFEMLGLTVFIYALLRHLARHFGEFRVKFKAVS